MDPEITIPTTLHLESIGYASVMGMSLSELYTKALDVYLATHNPHHEPVLALNSSVGYVVSVNVEDNDAPST
jgi:hypothetical protein